MNFYDHLTLEAILPSLKDPKNRTYADRYHVWKYIHYHDRDISTYSEGEEIEIYDGEKLAKGEIKHLYDGSDFIGWFREMGNHFGEEVKIFPPDDDEVFTLIGMSYTYLDSYYILKRKDGSKLYHSCVGGVKFKEDW